jgi:BolA family transcriptional regulator, general stress-responsive regulator
VSRREKIESAIKAFFNPEHVELIDQSHRHAGHAGAADGRGHFDLLVVSSAFAGKLPLARHRLIYAAVGELMQTDIHALSIKAFTPEEYKP